MPRAKKRFTPVSADSLTIKEPEHCQNCGICTTCQSRSSRKRSYGSLIVFALITGSFLLGMFLPKIVSWPLGNSSPSSALQPSTLPDTTHPLHIAAALGMNSQKFAQCLESGKYTGIIASDVADGKKAGVSGTPALYINGIPFIGLETYDTYKQIIDKELALSQSSDGFFEKIGNTFIQQAYALGDTSAFLTPTVTASPTPLPRVILDTGSFQPLGNPYAKVTVIEFADFQCPYCKQFYSSIESQLIQNYVLTGKVKFVFRNFPFLGPDSFTAAAGAYCANEQGKFWEYHNFLYEHQQRENSGQFTKKNLE